MITKHNHQIHEWNYEGPRLVLTTCRTTFRTNALRAACVPLPGSGTIMLE